MSFKFVLEDAIEKILNPLNHYMAGGMYVPHLDDGLNSRWHVFITVKQFWIIALLGWYAMISQVFSWAASFPKAVNTLVLNNIDVLLPAGDHGNFPVRLNQEQN